MRSVDPIELLAPLADHPQHAVNFANQCPFVDMPRRGYGDMEALEHSDTDAPNVTHVALRKNHALSRADPAVDASRHRRDGKPVGQVTTKRLHLD
jgi:hypothetical protein